MSTEVFPSKHVDRLAQISMVSPEGLDCLLEIGLPVNWNNPEVFTQAMELASSSNYQRHMKGLSYADQKVWEVLFKGKNIWASFGGDPQPLVAALLETGKFEALGWLVHHKHLTEEMLLENFASFERHTLNERFFDKFEKSRLGKFRQLSEVIRDFRKTWMWVAALNMSKLNQLHPEPFASEEILRFLNAHREKSRTSFVAQFFIADRKGSSVWADASEEIKLTALEQHPGLLYHMLSQVSGRNISAEKFMTDMFPSLLPVHVVHQEFSDLKNVGASARWHGPFADVLCQHMSSHINEHVRKNEKITLEMMLLWAALACKSNKKDSGEKDIDEKAIKDIFVGLWENKSIERHYAQGWGLLMGKHVLHSSPEQRLLDLPQYTRALTSMPHDDQSRSHFVRSLWRGLHLEDNEDNRPTLAQLLWTAIMTSGPNTQASWVQRFVETQKHVHENPRLNIAYKFPNWDLLQPAFEEFSTRSSKKPERDQEAVLRLVVAQNGPQKGVSQVRKM